MRNDGHGVLENMLRVRFVRWLVLPTVATVLVLWTGAAEFLLQVLVFDLVMLLWAIDDGFFRS